MNINQQRWIDRWLGIPLWRRCRDWSLLGVGSRRLQIARDILVRQRVSGGAPHAL